MPTTYNWIYLGVPRTQDAANTVISIDPTEGNATSENASQLVGRSFGGSGSPLYNQITSTTVSDNGGLAGQLDTNNTSSNDTFVTNIGAGNQTFTYDGVASYTATITYADGTTATTTVILAQSTTGELFLAPPTSTENTALTAKPIQSLSLGAVGSANANYSADRLQTGWDNGFVDGTAGGELIDGSYVEAIGSGSDRIDNGDGISSGGTAWNDDRVRAGAGNDTVLGGLGNDSILGEAGDDSLNGGAGADTIDGGADNDIIVLDSGFGADSIIGGTGTDTLSGAGLTTGSTVTFTNGSGSFASGGSTATFNTIESVVTGSGADSINATGNSTTPASYSTGAGSDTILGGAAAETILAGDDADSINGGAGADTIDAGAGNDTITLGTGFGADSITGGAGSDTLSGSGLTTGSTVTFTNGSGSFASGGSTATFNTIESVVTGSGADSINATGNSTTPATYSTGTGNDTILGGAANETVVAGEGADSIDGGAGADTIDAGAGNDTASGGAGADVVNGGAGNDFIAGGTLVGGVPTDDNVADTLTGGAGRDTFFAGNNDVITDFTTTGDPADIDTIDLSSYYNDANLAIINQSRVGSGLEPYSTPLAWMRADQADDGVLNSITTANGFGDNFTLTVQNAGTPVDAVALSDANTGVTCFAADVLIETASGLVPAGDIAVGTLIRTRDHGLQPVRWVGQRAVSATELAAQPHLRPIRIRQGALGQGLPDKDLVVSPQHRVLVRSAIAQRMFGAAEVLVAAKHLCEVEGIEIAQDLEQVTYVHLLMDDHQIVYSNGAATESFYVGPEAIRAIDAAAVEEIMALFPELDAGQQVMPARPFTNGRLGRKLASRHQRNQKDLVS